MFHLLEGLPMTGIGDVFDVSAQLGQLSELPAGCRPIWECERWPLYRNSS